MAKAIKTRNAGTMTESEYFGMLRSLLRRASMRWIPMKQALEAARRPSQSSNLRLKWEYQCAECKQWFPESKIQKDHIEPCGTLKTLEDLPAFISKLLPENPDEFQILCKDVCHKAKTNQERKSRTCQ